MIIFPTSCPVMKSWHLLLPRCASLSLCPSATWRFLLTRHTRHTAHTRETMTAAIVDIDTAIAKSVCLLSSFSPSVSSVADKPKLCEKMCLATSVRLLVLQSSHYSLTHTLRLSGQMSVCLGSDTWSCHCLVCRYDCRVWRSSQSVPSL